MKRMWAIICLTSAMAWFHAGTVFAGEEAGLKAPTAEIVIEGEKKAAKFSHQVHLDLGVACGQCHHNSDHQELTTQDIGAMDNNMQLRCASCHNQDFVNPNLNSPKAAFHARCKECHKQGVNGKTGPTKCTDCHIK